jgi:hypothetical protein
MMKNIFSFFKKTKPNKIIFFNIIFIIVVFGGINKYNSKRYPTKSEQKIDGIKYIAIIDRHKYSKDSIMVITFSMQNSKRAKKEIAIKREKLFNIEIYKENILIYKRDYFDKLSGEIKKIKLAGYGKIVTGYEWNFIPNGEIDNIEYGKYYIRIYSKDLKTEMKIPFEISEEGL